LSIGTDSIEVSKGNGNQWQTGKLSDAVQLVVFHGRPLQPFTRYYWTVQVWDKDGQASPRSAVANFETGMMNRAARTPRYLMIRDTAKSWRTTPVMFTPALVTSDGFEYQFGINHLGPFLLTRLLFRLPKLNKALEGSETVLIRHGKVDWEALKKEALSELELKGVLHKQGLSDFSEVERCTLEPSGTRPTYGAGALRRPQGIALRRRGKLDGELHRRHALRRESDTAYSTSDDLGNVWSGDTSQHRS